MATSVSLVSLAACDPPAAATQPPTNSQATANECVPSPENCGCKECPQPDPDPDGDGLVADQDACPDVPEDPDGFEDGDGCPDPDNDKDGIKDAVQNAAGEWENHDRRVLGKQVIDCRDRPEDQDGVEDEDGCPEVVAIVDCQLQKSGKIVFEFNKAYIRPQSYPVLDEIVAEMQMTPELKIRVENHKDSRGSNAYGRRPTRDRSRSVREYLIDKGIAPERVEAVGFGEDRPIASNKTEEGRALNRRTEFWVQDCR